jgi:hypothetical protein
MDADRTPRTAAATRAASRKAQLARANWLRERGWLCIEADGLDVEVRLDDDAVIYVLRGRK